MYLYRMSNMCFSQVPALDIGYLGVVRCAKCCAYLFQDESCQHQGVCVGKNCCSKGKVELASLPVHPELEAMWSADSLLGTTLRAHARKFNNALALASMKVDHVVTQPGVYVRQPLAFSSAYSM